jgi:hypothetical protein
MKRSLFLLCALVLSVLAAGPLAGQGNPFVGTWKLNLAKSKYVGAPAPKDSTRTVTLNGKTATYLFTGTAADGSAVKYSFDTIYDGKDSAVTGSGMPGGADSIALTRITARHTTGVLKKGGKEVAKADATVSKDGKVATVTTKGTGADGKPYSVTSVYDKQ